jgi:hypothetical protein
MHDGVSKINMEKIDVSAVNNITNSTEEMQLLDALPYVGYSRDHLMNMYGVCAAMVKTEEVGYSVEGERCMLVISKASW